MVKGGVYQMTKNKISVIMPLYNAEPYIEKAVNSILNQTYENFELIIIDDCPKDNTLEIVSKFKDDRIRMIHNKENKGIAYSRNAGLKSACGEFIALMDHDDIAVERRFEIQTKYLKENTDVDVLGGSIQLINENDDPLSPPTNAYTNADYIEALFLFYNVFCNSEVMFRRKLTEENHIYYHDDCLGMEDFRFWIECSKVGKMNCVSDLLLYHRMISENETMRVMTNFNEERRRLFSDLQNYSLARSGFRLDENYLKILNQVMTEDQQGVCKNGREVELLYRAFRELVVQAEERCLHNCTEIKDMCRFYFTSRTRLMNSDYLWE